MRKILITMLVCVAMPVLCNAECPAWTLESTQGDRYSTRLARSNPWIDDALTTLIDEGLEPKWLYLMLAESGGWYSAESEKGARGPWQLMPATAKHYGCSNPEAPICATHAAAKYLRKLLKDFDGNERDAIIGYNMGGSNYRRKKIATAQGEALASEVMCLFTHDPLNLMSY